MQHKQSVLVVKVAALGDVVRTASLLPVLAEMGYSISWLGGSQTSDFFKGDPFVSNFYNDVSEITTNFDWVINLEEDAHIAKKLSALNAKRVTGIYWRGSAGIAYSLDSSLWFDMSLVSRFGKAIADALKRNSRISYRTILSHIIGSPITNPYLHANEGALRRDGEVAISVNWHCGPRWPNKTLRPEYRVPLIRLLLDECRRNFGDSFVINILGAGADRDCDLSVFKNFSPHIKFPDTANSLSSLVSFIRSQDYVITCDSLIMHIATAFRAKTVAFFSLSPAHEFGDYGNMIKVISLDEDYAVISPSTSNASITPERLLRAFKRCLESRCRDFDDQYLDPLPPVGAIL